MSQVLDTTAAQLSASLAEGLPIASRPFAEAGARIGMSEAELLGALRALRVEPCAAPRPRPPTIAPCAPFTPFCCWLWPQPLPSPKIPVKMPLKAIQ